jgi:hypothetical protein
MLNTCLTVHFIHVDIEEPRVIHILLFTNKISNIVNRGKGFSLSLSRENNIQYYIKKKLVSLLLTIRVCR